MTAIVVPELKRHIKVRHGSDGTSLERCEDADCRVAADGIAVLPEGIALECECGYSWIPAAQQVAAVAGAYA
jgi:hypothetical protein